ncbi:hypothetical protein [Kangiella sediminilitoris]|uniref:RcnB family protein n=1 Tax=Kangiella sediminilitoris TaxID=1144748 RepID=A0A1B3BB63_9GAMM|nr:hypothetical protein [Kangiella sediminilitoris]AOE50017.1 hypothetical protein KS2013_1303 [Kangiella sediminilitoris]
MIKQKLTLISLAVAFAISAPVVMAKGKPEHAQNKSEKEVKQSKAKQSNKRHFDDGARDTIRNYYDRYYDDRGRLDTSRSDLPPGLQKKYQRTGQLPPGWQKKVQAGHVLPIDIYRYGHEIPYDLRRRLPLGPVGSKIIEVEGKIIRLMEGTRMILDVFDIR